MDVVSCGRPNCVGIGSKPENNKIYPGTCDDCTIRNAPTINRDEDKDTHKGNGKGKGKQSASK